MKREDFKYVKILLEKEIMQIEDYSERINVHGLTPTEIQDINTSIKSKIKPYKDTLELIRLATRDEMELRLDSLKNQQNYQRSIGQI